MKVTRKFLLSTAVLVLMPAAGYAQTASAPDSANATPAGAAQANPSSEPGQTTSQAAAVTPAATDDIIVTANRRQESLSRVGVSVAVVTAAQLQIQEVRQPADLARVVPGFQATTSALTGSPVFILRGVGFDTPNATSTAPVGTYVDEVAYAYPYMSLGANFDLERVEVLKGPQGTLYGRNATGGLIDFITAKPTDTAQGALTMGYGNYDSFLVDGFVSGPLTDKLKARLAFQSEGRATGYQYSVTRPDDRLGTRYRKSLRGTVQWDPSDRLSFTASGTYWQLNGEPQAPQAIADLAPAALLNPLAAASVIANPTNNRQADWTPTSRQPVTTVNGLTRPFYGMNSQFAGGMLKGGLKLTDAITLASLTSFNHLSFDTVAEVNGLQTESQTAESTGSIDSFSQELRLVGDMGRFNWSAGGYYAHDTTHEYDVGYVGELYTIVNLRNAALAVDAARGNPVDPNLIRYGSRNYAAQGDYKNEVYAGFVNAEYAFGSKFKVSAGGRYTQDSLAGSGCGRDVNGDRVALTNILYPVLTRNPALQGIQPNGCTSLNVNDTAFGLITQSQKQHNFSWRGRADYTPSDTVLFYGSVSRGYKAGTIPVLTASNASQLAPVTQEKLTAYEVGSKVNLFDRVLQINVSGYYYDYINRQVFGRVPDLIFGTLQRIVNIPKSEVYGAEVSANLRVTSTLRLQAAGSYLHSEVKTFTGYNNQVAAAVVNYAGATLPYSPKFQANGSITNDMPIGSGNIKLFTSIYGSYQSRSSSVIGNETGFGIKAYGLLGAKLGVHSANDAWGVEGYVTNLTNTYYWTSVQRTSEALDRFAGLPRMYGARVSFRF